MWIKLARNPFWLAFCIGISAIAYCCDAAQRDIFREESVYGATSGKTPLAKGVYIIPARYREMLPLPLGDDGIYHGPIENKLVISATEFPLLSSVRTARDCVIVARVRYKSTRYDGVYYDEAPKFTVFVPQYMTKNVVIVTAYDAGEHPHSSVKIDEFVTASKADGIVRATYVFPQFSTPNVKRVEVTFLP